MKIVYINPNATVSMTDGIVEAARKALPEAEIVGLTNTDGPPAIEGPEDGDASVPGMLACLTKALSQGADAVVIACFDDTGLAEARAVSPCPVLGIGQASYVTAMLLGQRFSVVTSLPVSVPVIEGNIEKQGFSGLCASVRASGLAVLTIEKGTPETLDQLVEEIGAARQEDDAQCIILGCAGMAPLRDELAARTGLTLIDGVAASAQLARAAALSAR
ncbi:aspartate/glutamate racemase family protein [Chachezhania sediminis]|uniref:aspartate/glutamate racemase family protein n=1 Tax=Chachezhania sediminis TaxID=2599291 RepID=UPI00131BA574|nr:aspartate/glutamate racemase family protein [Chachezhania sediminis]